MPLPPVIVSSRSPSLPPALKGAAVTSRFLALLAPLCVLTLAAAEPLPKVPDGFKCEVVLEARNVKGRDFIDGPLSAFLGGNPSGGAVSHASSFLPVLPSTIEAPFGRPKAKTTMLPLFCPHLKGRTSSLELS